MPHTAVPGRDELVRRTEDLVPSLRKHASWSEENRRLHDEAVEALAAAGVFRMRVPRRYGGFESPAATLVDVAAALAHADASLAWTASVYWIPTWMAGLFPDAVQEEVFAAPDTRVCGTLSPSGTAVPARGGISVTGRWGFMTGAPHAHWQEIIAVLARPGAEPEPVVALVPMADVKLVDDWRTTAMRGTGSVTTAVEDLFVPEERVLPLRDVLAGSPAPGCTERSGLHRAPLLPVAAASSVGTAVGLADAALAAFRERLPGRGITYTAYGSQREAPLTHRQVAGARLRADESRFHAERLAGTVDAKAAAGAEWTTEERARVRADLGAACERAREAVDLVAEAGGGSSVREDVPLQKIAADLRGINLHALMYPEINTELYGRVLCGLDPATPYV